MSYTVYAVLGKEKLDQICQRHGLRHIDRINVIDILAELGSKHRTLNKGYMREIIGKRLRGNPAKQKVTSALRVIIEEYLQTVEEYKKRGLI